MSNLGPKWEDNEDYSPHRMDAKTIIRDTGDNIVALATTRQIGMAIPTANGSGLVKNVCYIVDYDGSFNRIQFIPIFVKHLHDADTNEAGGSLFNIEHANVANVIRINLVPMNTTNWDSAATGGTLNLQVDAENTDGGAYLQQKTTTTTNNLITSSLRGCKLSFADKLMFQLKGKLSHNSNLLIRFGINVDRVQDSQDIARRQMGLEGCDGHGTNFVIINANGNSSSLTTTPTSAVLNPANAQNYKLVHIPATEVRLYLDGVSNAVSTTNVASSGESFQPAMFRTGVKLPTGTTEKIWKFWNVCLVGKPTEFK